LLRNKLSFTDDQVAAVARDFRTAGLPPEEVAMLAYAEKLTLDAGSITAEDVDELRRHGFSDEEIIDIALTAAYRNMQSRLYDALGAKPPGAEELKLEAALHRELTKGRG
jgi:uncharacterized peroxidase-related enzyme